MPLSAAEPLRSRRFELVRHLGAGGMGTVFEAIDRQGLGRVAVKTVHAESPHALLYLKNEFRALQDVRHTNLVNLLELIEEDGRFFVAMELVTGSDFLSYVRSGAPPVALSGLSETRQISAVAPDARAGGGPAGDAARESEPSAPGSFDEARLRDAFGQLAAGLCALHASGKLHRDVKPSNILVTPSGRVVLADFGLATDLAPGGAKSEASGIGTRAFTAPEQYAGQQLGSAADWFSAGVSLYVALTGVLPFRGELARQRAHGEFTPVRALCPSAPQDLSELCADLLDPEPERRPSGREVLARLGRSEERSTALQSSVFVGRHAELGALGAALLDSRAHAVSVLVSGDSGVGKSTLVRQAIERSCPPGTLVLVGRCYERELVPYKALDGIVDALSHFLLELGERELAALIPPNAALLARVFPVLERVPAFGSRPSELTGDPLALRAEAFAALRELFARLAERAPVLLYIDDLQWADADSYVLLSDLLREPAAPKLCLLATTRPSVASASSAPDRWLALERTLGDARKIRLEPLPPEEARSLARALVAEHDPELARAIAEEAAGHPLFVVALAQHASNAGGFSAGALKLDDALYARVESIEPSARHLLELLATAGAPLATELLQRAADVDPLVYARGASALRVARLVRASGEQDARIEPYHDRVRETVLAHLTSAARRAHHGRLAELLEQADQGGDPQALVRHLEGAGLPERAAHQAELAASRALSALAFDQAAELYQVALRLGSFDAERKYLLNLRLAEALTNAGRAGEAAAAYLRCAEGAQGGARLQHRRQAADHMLRSGHLEEGLEIVADVLRGLGEDFPSRRAALVRTLAWRFKRRLRGLGWRPRAASEVPAATLERLDAFHGVGVSLALIDPIRGGYFEERALALALDVGEPLRLAAVLLMEQGYLASVSERGERAARPLQAIVTEIERLTADPYTIAISRMIRGFREIHAGEFARAAERLGASIPAFRALPGTYFEQAFCHCFRLICLRHRGQLAELQAGFEDWVREAERRGDRFTEASLRFNLNNVWLARDQPAEAVRDLERVDWVQPRGGYHMQHWYKQHARAEVELYAGRAAHFLPEFRAIYRQLSRSLIMRMRVHRCIAQWLLARLILAAHGALPSGELPAALREVSRLASELGRERVGYAETWSLLLQAAVAECRRDAPRARALLGAASARAELAELPSCAASASLQLGRLTAGEPGRALLAQGLAWFREQQIENPERMVLVWAPGFGSE